MASHHAGDSHGEQWQAPGTRTVVDPVCGMTVDTAAAKPSFDHNGELFHFCSQGCRDKFVANPDHYILGQHRREAISVLRY